MIDIAADALSDSTPVMVTVGAAITMVSVAFGMGLVWARGGARVDRIDGKDGSLERLAAAVKEARDAAKESSAAALAEIAKAVAGLRREIADLDRDGSAGDAALAARIHRLGDITQDLQVRIAQAETHLGYDGRGQATPVRAEPMPARPKRRATDPPPGDSRG